MRKFNVVIFGKPPGKIPNFFFGITKNVAFSRLGRKNKKSWYHAQKGKYEVTMIRDEFMERNFFNLANINIRYSPISQA